MHELTKDSKYSSLPSIERICWLLTNRTSINSFVSNLFLDVLSFQQRKLPTKLYINWHMYNVYVQLRPGSSLSDQVVWKASRPRKVLGRQAGKQALWVADQTKSSFLSSKTRWLQHNRQSTYLKKTDWRFRSVYRFYLWSLWDIWRLLALWVTENAYFSARLFN